MFDPAATPFKNAPIVHYLLREIARCFDKETLHRYAAQLRSIERVEWIEDRLVDLYLGACCREHAVAKWQDGEPLARLHIKDRLDGENSFCFYAKDGFISSIEGERSFRTLEADAIKRICVECRGQERLGAERR